MICRRQRNGQIGTPKQRREIKRRGWQLVHYDAGLDGDGEAWTYDVDVEIKHLDGLIAAVERGQQ